jgi:lycopene beta-cyclase
MYRRDLPRARRHSCVFFTDTEQAFPVSERLAFDLLGKLAVHEHGTRDEGARMNSFGRVVPDVVVVGLGPAGRALAHRCLARGLSVTAIDPHPDRPWLPTYATWVDELPPWLPLETIAHVVRAPAVWTRHRQTLHRSYCFLDNVALHEALSIDDAHLVRTPATQVQPHRRSVTLADGRQIFARTVIDARGAVGTRGRAQQSAYGLIVDTDTAAPAMEGADAWFMDWRLDNGAHPDEPPSFLYAMPLGVDQVLLEETCLVGRPPVDLKELRQRLSTRLIRRGVVRTGEEKVECVRFPVESSRAHGAFGARGGLMHPATGYSVAACLAAADPVAKALARHGSVRRAVWPLRARVVDRFRRVGLNALLGMDSSQTAQFFGTFFELPMALQRAYLSGRTDVAGTLAAMRRLYTASPPEVRRRLMRAPVTRADSPPIHDPVTVE